ncbi:MAG: class II aldolase/adducin family protein [Gammaproteobacteria bacterium]|nr:class II aldolase/adducin family protein [Gammaproteobacteria bacterium]
MTSEEGIIKFQLDFSEAEPLPAEIFRELNIWRDQMFTVGLIGKDPDRYEGYSYGNVSQRLTPGKNAFIICGSQTGGIPLLNEQHYVTVDSCDFSNNRIEAHGPIKPSSESLTHGIIYQSDPSINFVLHVHSPEIWHLRQQLNIPCTSADAAYGTQEMVQEVRQLLGNDTVKNGHIFAMDGHEDGIVSFGTTGEIAAGVLTTLLNKALEN